MVKKTLTLLLCAWFVGATAFPIQVTHAATDVLNDATLSTGLVAYYELEETSGTRTDSHTGGYDLTDTGSVSYAAGVQGNAADFESGSSQYLSIASTLGTTQGTDMSVAFWSKLESNPATSDYWGVYEMRRNNGSTDDLWTLRLYRYTDGFNYFNLQKNADDFYKDSGPWWTTGAWHHIVVTYDADVGAKVYVDTTLRGTLNTTAVSTALSADKFSIGFNTELIKYHDGLIDEFGVWSKVLSGAEMTDLYNSGAGIPYDAGGPPAVGNATSTTPVRINGGSLRIQGGTFKNTQL